MLKHPALTEMRIGRAAAPIKPIVQVINRFGWRRVGVVELSGGAPGWAELPECDQVVIEPEGLEVFDLRAGSARIVLEIVRFHEAFAARGPAVRAAFPFARIRDADPLERPGRELARAEEGSGRIEVDPFEIVLRCFER